METSRGDAAAATWIVRGDECTLPAAERTSCSLVLAPQKSSKTAQVRRRLQGIHPPPRGRPLRGHAPLVRTSTTAWPTSRTARRTSSLCSRAWNLHSSFTRIYTPGFITFITGFLDHGFLPQNLFAGVYLGVLGNYPGNRTLVPQSVPNTGEPGLPGQSCQCHWRMVYPSVRTPREPRCNNMR